MLAQFAVAEIMGKGNTLVEAIVPRELEPFINKLTDNEFRSENGVEESNKYVFAFTKRV